jgi:hypothetical protein
VQGYQGRKSSANCIDWRALLVWTVIVVSFCVLFQLGTHALPHRIATLIVR